VLRYHAGQSYAVLGSRPLKVQPVTASITAPVQVVAGRVFEVSWVGPDNEGDFITLVPIATESNRWGSSNGYTMRGNPVRIEANKEAGAYEVRYLTGQSHRLLARAPVSVTPDTAAGALRVIGAQGQTHPAFSAVEFVIDASGSMLARSGGQRRIDIAKRALLGVLGDLPPGTPLALRVFGTRQANACRTDLTMPLAPLDVAATQTQINGIEPQNLARSPIGASLREVGKDLGTVTGPALVLLITDGEETCDGDPKAAIESLRAGGLDVRVNIVGFAIDEIGLKETFAAWADVGAGAYFDAQDSEELAAAVRAAVRAKFEVVAGEVVVATGAVDGAPVPVAPGTYRVRVPGSSRNIETTVEAGRVSEVAL
jgi:hypothetical protein